MWHVKHIQGIVGRWSRLACCGSRSFFLPYRAWGWRESVAGFLLEMRKRVKMFWAVLFVWQNLYVWTSMDHGYRTIGRSTDRLAYYVVFLYLFLFAGYSLYNLYIWYMMMYDMIKSYTPRAINWKLLTVSKYRVFRFPAAAAKTFRPIMALHP